MEDVHIQQKAGNEGTPWFKKKKFIFAGIVVAVAIGFLAYIGASQFATYYITVSEFVEEGDSLYGQHIRVAGHVDTESVSWDTENFTLSFTLVDGKASLPVIYQGAIPDTFRPGNDVVAEGKSDQQGVFHADNLITKCPSKYETSE